MAFQHRIRNHRQMGELFANTALKQQMSARHATSAFRCIAINLTTLGSLPPSAAQSANVGVSNWVFGPSSSPLFLWVFVAHPGHASLRS
jgi:hypothetical protein